MIFLTTALVVGHAVLPLWGGGAIDPLMILDGTYQTYGMLHRAALGLRVGADFVPYLGSLLCLALYPPFAALGGTVFAGFAAATLAVQLAWLVTLLLLGWAVAGSWRWAAPWALALFALGLLLRQFAAVFVGVYEPGNSLLTLRDSAPVLLALVFALAPARHARAVLAAVAGLLLWWSPTAGLGGLVAALTILMARAATSGEPWRKRLARAAASLAIAAAAAMLTAALLSRGDPLGLVRRVFVSTGGTQFWLFAGFGDHDRILTLADLPRLFPGERIAALAFLAACSGLALAWVRAPAGSRRRDAVALVALGQLLSGMAAQWGGHVMAHYLSPFTNSGLAALLLIGARGLFARRPFTGRERLAQLACGGALLGAAPHCPDLVGQWSPLFMRPAPVMAALPEAGMPFAAGAAGEIAFLRAERVRLDRLGVVPERRILSTYENWADVVVGGSARSPFNAIIMLMTPADREAFVARLTRESPELVTTADPEASFWALWNERAGWFFQRELLARYRPVARGAMALYWRAGAETLPGGALPACQVLRRSPTAVELRLVGAAPGGSAMADVALSYVADPGRPSLSGDLGRGYLRVTDRSSGLLAEVARHEAQGSGLDPIVDGRPGLRYGLPGGAGSAAVPVFQLGAAPSSLLLEVQGGRAARLGAVTCRPLRWLPSGRPPGLATLGTAQRGW